VKTFLLTYFTFSPQLEMGQGEEAAEYETSENMIFLDAWILKGKTKCIFHLLGMIGRYLGFFSCLQTK
jgi:hypothetical protein